MGKVHTDYIVPILVRDHDLQRTLAFFIDHSQCVNDLLPLLPRAILDGLFDNITGKLVLGEMDEMGGHKSNDLISILIFTFCNDMLGDIIAKLVNDE